MPNKQCSSTPGSGSGVSTVTGSTNRRKMHHHRNQLIRDKKAKPIADSSSSIQSVNSSTGPTCPSSVRVANFLIEFRYFKFRLTLVSRRKQSLQSFYSSPSQSDSSVRPSDHQLIQVEHQPSKHPGAIRRTGPHLPVHQPPVSITSSSSFSSTAPVTESTQNPSQGAEFVYFMEDLLPNLSSNLAINSVPNVNYHCLIYLNEALCHSLLINNGKVLVVDNPIPGKPMDLSAPCVSISPVVLPKKTKVYDQSLICLFKQPTLAPLQTPRLFETNLARGGLLGPSRTFQKPPLPINSESNDSDEEEDGSLRSSNPVLVNETIDTEVESEMSSEPDHDQSQQTRQTSSRIYSDEHKSTDEDDDDEDRLLGSSSHNRQYRNNRQTVGNETRKKRFDRERASERSRRPRRNDRGNRQRGRFNVDEQDTDSEMTDELGPESEDRLCEILNELHHKPLNSMIKYIRNKLLLKRAHIEQRNELVGEMERILRDNNFNCRLYMFGSTKNWLGLKSSSDIDIFVRLRDRNNRSVDESLMSYTKIERVLNQIDEILTSNQLLLARMLAKHCGENSPDESDDSDDSDDEDNATSTVTSTGRHSPSSVRTHSMNGICENVHIQVICHRHMRVPICRLKFSKSSIVAAVDRGGVGRGSDGISKRTKPVPVSAADEDEVGGLRVHTTNEHLLQCDLNVNNALGIANTRFIRFLCKFEPRFLVLNVLLRFWSKHVAGLNRPDALSSYALTNLVLYFFQTRVPSILPPVDYFVKLSTEQRIINDWRCDFCKDMSLIHYRTDNTESVIDLLIGFFRFYERFNFVGCKISTRYAKAWKLRRMANTGNTGSRGRHVDRLPFVHLMDPFEQCHNLTSRMRSKKFNRMCQQFRLAAIRYEKYL